MDSFMIPILIIMVLFAWFLLDDSSSVGYKLMLITSALIIYVFIMIARGASSFEKVFKPLVDIFT